MLITFFSSLPTVVDDEQCIIICFFLLLVTGYWAWPRVRTSLKRIGEKKKDGEIPLFLRSFCAVISTHYFDSSWGVRRIPPASYISKYHQMYKILPPNTFTTYPVTHKIFLFQVSFQSHTLYLQCCVTKC